MVLGPHKKKTEAMAEARAAKEQRKAGGAVDQTETAAAEAETVESVESVESVEQTEAVVGAASGADQAGEEQS